MVVGAYSARDDVVFGTVLSGRLQALAGADQMLGAFINTLPVRLSLNDDCETTLKRFHQMLCELVCYEQYPLVEAQAFSHVDVGQPLFSAVLNYRHSGLSVEQRKKVLVPSGIELLKLNERTNYPFTLCVDDFDLGFDLLVQIDQSNQGDRVMELSLIHI